MNRKERRVEGKSRRRKLKWLEMMRKRGKKINQVVTALEENFDEDEIESAKVLFADYITSSGFFASRGSEIAPEDLEEIARHYGLEPFDGMFILDLLEEMSFSDEEEPDG